MQPDYTFALQVEQRAAAIQKTLSAALAYLPAKPGCLLYRPKQRQHLIKLADDLTTLASAKSTPVHDINQADVLSDIVTSNLGYLRSLSVASKGPFRLCGKTAQLGRPACCLLLLVVVGSHPDMPAAASSLLIVLQPPCLHVPPGSQHWNLGMHVISCKSGQQSLPAVGCTTPPKQQPGTAPWKGCQPAVGLTCITPCGPAVPGVGYRATCTLLQGAAVWNVTGRCPAGEGCRHFVHDKARCKLSVLLMRECPQCCSCKLGLIDICLVRLQRDIITRHHVLVSLLCCPYVARSSTVLISRPCCADVTHSVMVRSDQTLCITANQGDQARRSC
jgi:hypothetical protein